MGDLDARFNRAVALERARSLGIAVNGNPIMDAAQAGAVRPLLVLRCGSCFLFTTAQFSSVHDCVRQGWIM